jgi:RHH-type rel operon transcriptional repressor/antitoxin RelB
MGMKSVTVRIEDELDSRLERLARETHRTKSFYVREAILKALEDVEDIYLAEKRLEDIRAGRTKTIPLEDVVKKHGI